MSFLLDTDTCSAYFRNVRHVHNRFLQYGGRLYTSAVTIAELHVWLLRRKTPLRYVQGYGGLRQQLQVFDVDEMIALKAGELGAGLANRGLTSKIPDLMIAATALIHGFTVVTHNIRDFASIPGLSLVDWLVP